MKLMGKSVIHIANSISDGMPNALLEAMAMGAFPIQSNPGKLTEEVIVHGVNGYLIDNPFDTIEIARCIEKALVNQDLRKTAQEYNVKFIEDNYNREILKNKIIEMYKQIN